MKDKTNAGREKTQAEYEVLMAFMPFKLDYFARSNHSELIDGIKF